MISPYCVISLVKIFIFIEWLYSTPKVLCYVINIYIISYFTYSQTLNHNTLSNVYFSYMKSNVNYLMTHSAHFIILVTYYLYELKLVVPLWGSIYTDHASVEYFHYTVGFPFPFSASI